MLELNVQADIMEIQRALGRLGSDVIPAAAATALNKTIKTVESAAVKEISTETGIRPQKKVRDAMKIYAASRNRLVAAVRAFPNAINLIEFVTPSRRHPGAFRKAKGVTAKAWGKAKVYEGAFIAYGSGSGKALVYARKTKKRMPIRALPGPSIPKTFVQRKVDEVMRKRAGEAWIKNIQHEIAYRISRL